MGLFLLKLLFEKINEIYEHIGFFLLSAFLKMYLVETFSLVFMFGWFLLLSTFKNIAITQNVSHNFKTMNYLDKKRVL